MCAQPVLALAIALISSVYFERLSCPQLFSSRLCFYEKSYKSKDLTDKSGERRTLRSG